MPDEPKFPNVRVNLDGEDGNAFAIIGRCTRAMKRAGMDNASIEQFTQEAMRGDYDDLLRTCMKWLDAT